MSEKVRVEALWKVEKVWNYQLLLEVGDKADYKQMKCL
jgi:hypothetical protein